MHSVGSGWTEDQARNAKRPSSRQTKLALLAIAIYAAAILALLPWARVQGPEMPQIVSLFTAALVVGELATAFLLLTDSIQQPSPSSLWLGCAYLYAAVMGIVHILTFPSSVLADRLVIGTPSVTGYIFNAWRLGFITLVFCSIVAPLAWERRPSDWITRVRLAVSAVAVGTAAIIGLGLALEDSSAPLSNSFSIWISGPSWTGVALGVLALATLCIRHRLRDSLHVWMCLVLVAFCGDLIVSTWGGARYTLGWFAGRTSGVISGLTLFILFLLRFARQQSIVKAELGRTSSLFQTVINMTPDLVFVKDLQSRALLRNPAALFGRSWADVKGRPEAEWHVSAEEAAVVVQNDRLVIESGHSMQFVEHFTTSQGKRVLLSTKSPLLDENGKIVGIIGVSTDITEREKRVRQIEFVMHELSHRSKNLLMILQSIARQSIRQSNNFEEFEARFMPRINALALLHDLLLNEEWRGVGLHALAESQVRPFAGDRFCVMGPEFFVGPQIAQTISLVFHELATNASKYGALSNTTGTVSISWGYQSSKRDFVFLKWEETGGPLVSVPKRRGFGSVVLERSVLHVPNATASLQFEERGIMWCLIAPTIAFLEASTQNASCVLSTDGAK